MPFASRPLSTVVRSAAEPRHYAALLRTIRCFDEAPDVLRRYLRGTGWYPWTASVRTPIGRVRARLHHPHDVRTLIEVFSRRDYGVPDGISVAVDVGSNIGLSALYFLSRNEHAVCHLFEPDPRNVRRLRENLGPFEGRFTVEEVAVLDAAGSFSFGIEASGRYGGIGRRLDETIVVRARDIRDVLDEAVARNGRIDVLKIDTEGTERQIVAAIEPRLLTRIDLIYLEDEHLAESLHPTLFRQSKRGHCVRLERLDR